MQLLENSENPTKKLMKTLQKLLAKNFVDDLNFEVNNVGQDFALFKRKKLSAASFIRKLRTNGYTLCKLIFEWEGSDDRKCESEEKNQSYEKVLGKEWNDYQDIFIFQPQSE